jgi:hypothetical protein
MYIAPPRLWLLCIICTNPHTRRRAHSMYFYIAGARPLSFLHARSLLRLLLSRSHTHSMLNAAFASFGPSIITAAAAATLLPRRTYIYVHIPPTWFAARRPGLFAAAPSPIPDDAECSFGIVSYVTFGWNKK